MSKDKIDNDRIDYCYVYLTGKVRLIIKKLWIKRIDLVKEQKQKKRLSKLVMVKE